MAAMRGSRLPIGSSAWITEERTSALQIAESEVEEFAFSARNDFDWLNEHMAEIFNENEINVAEIFKTPGKLRGRTPRTARKANPVENRVPLSDIFSGTPNGAMNSFAQQLNRMQSPKPNAADLKPTATSSIQTSIQRPVPSPKRTGQQTAVPSTDSGYHGSQPEDTMAVDRPVNGVRSPQPARPARNAVRSPDHVAFHAIKTHNESQSPTRTGPMSPEHTFHTAREGQTTRVMPEMTQRIMSPIAEAQPSREPVNAVPTSPRPVAGLSGKVPSPLKSSPFKSSPEKAPAPAQKTATVLEYAEEEQPADDLNEMRSPSDGSSPIRPVVRKSSLNFASLPAREPLATQKSIGARVSRTSHLDHHRTSYYSRPTGGKSLGNIIIHSVDDDDHDEMDIDETTIQAPRQCMPENLAINHNKTYRQRLQDQISMLGKSQANVPRPSKSIANLPSQQAPTPALQQAPEPKPESPKRKPVPAAAPGAFPEDDEDDWIEPPATETKKSIFSPRPAIPKSYTADAMQGIRNKDTIHGAEFVLPKQRQQDGRPASPLRGHVPMIPERTTSTFSHHKSASVSVPVLPNFGFGPASEDGATPKKGISVSNPTLASVSEIDRPDTPSKSPSRSFRDSPLKQVKNKLSSILKGSKGLLASSAAISAEGKALVLSPSTTRLGIHNGPSTESIAPSSIARQLYPDLSKQTESADAQTISSTSSPPRGNARKTRASAEREKEAKRREKELKLMNEQMDKLQRAREKESEKARVFSEEQERVASMEKQVVTQKEQEKAQAPQAKEAPKPTRTSPRKAKAQQEAEARAAAVATPAARRVVDEDVEMADVPSSMPPPTAPRSAGPSQAMRNREIKRPMKPTKEAPSKTKTVPPRVIHVNTGSQHSQFLPSNSTLSSNLGETLTPASSHHQLNSKASQASLKTKASSQSLKSSTSSNGRLKALDMAAKKKEQEEREAQRKREAKADMERKRAALQEEERRQEQQRRLEVEKQKEKERELAAQAEAKKKQAAIERAKQTRAPPPAARSQPKGPPGYGRAAAEDTASSGAASQRVDAGPARPPSRLTSTVSRSQEEQGRPVNAVLSNIPGKAPVKRPLGQDSQEDGGRNPQARSGPTYQAKDAKRRRTSEDFGDEVEMGGQQSNIKGPPVRPSGGFKKDLPTKSMFQNGYTNAPPSAARDLFKATVTAQHNNKAAHPLDMSQFSKGVIPFAPNPNAVAAGSASAAAAPHKTPARPPAATGKSAAKSAAKSSPRFQNGEAIELPEIQTDDEDEDEDEAHLGVAPWADSPDLRRALVRQETMDPSQIFGPPAPLVMEEVFSKSKDRWHKFRARTSSANWSGSDRLTEDDIRKDMAARDKMRRDGGWSYEMSKEML